MAEGNKKMKFGRFLSRIRKAKVLSTEDEQVVQHFAENQRTRQEAEITRFKQVMTPRSFLWTCGPTGGPVPKYHSLNEGLRSSGWSEIPSGGKTLGSGAYGTIRLAYKLADEGRVGLESRHLAAVKCQP